MATHRHILDFEITIHIRDGSQCGAIFNSNRYSNHRLARRNITNLTTNSLDSLIGLCPCHCRDEQHGNSCT